MKTICKMLRAGLGVVLMGAFLTAIGAAHAGGWRPDEDQLVQVAELEQQIHVTFHAAVSVHDPVNGDSPEVITQRIRDALSIWTKDAELTLSALLPRRETISATAIRMIPK